MHSLAVHWHEGLFLRPHHLQAWDRHWHETTTASERWQSPYNYGVARIAINADALSAGFFQLDGVRAKMPEGTLIELSPGEATERVDLRPALAGAENDSTTIPIRGSAGFDVFLAVPRLQLGGCNVDNGNTDQATRFRPQTLRIPDDSDGASVEPILFRRLNAKLFLSTDDLAGYDTLRIARVVRSNSGGTIAAMDPLCMPPLLDCAAWPTMRMHVLRPILDLLSTKAETLGTLIKEHSVDPSSGKSADIQNYLTLQALNQAAAVTSVLTQSAGIHPFDAYMELARIAGSFDMLGPQRGFEPIAAYDHEAIGPLFHALRRRIETRLRSAGDSPYQQRFLVGTTLSGGPVGMSVAMSRAWFDPQWQYVFGVRRGEVSAEEVESMFSAGKLDYKIGSAAEVDALFEKRASGVKLTPLRTVPKSLPTQSQWTYFAITADGPAWADVERTGTLAMRIQERSIGNRSSLEGSRTVVIQVGGRELSLQCALFAFDGTNV